MGTESLPAIQVDGVQIVYRRVGNGRPLLVLNGFAATSADWESVYREFGDIVAAARAQLSPGLVNRQAAAMDAWHRTGVGNRLREMNLPVLIATGTADIVIPPFNALKLVNAIPGAWLAQFNGGHAFHVPVRASAGRSRQ